MYSSFYGSMPSMAEIVLDTINPLTLAQDSASTLCHGQADASVTLQGLGGLAPYRFQWADGVEDSTRTALAAGSYVIDIADAQGCSGQDTLQIAEPDTLIASVVATDSLTCAGSGQLTTVVQGGVPSYNYVWSDGSTAAAANGLGPGPHTVTVTDQNGCTDTAGFTLIEADTFLTTTAATPCAGTPYLWQNQSFTADTSLCLVYSSQYGCDSTYCLELSFISRASEQQVQLCPGEAYPFGGELLTASGTYQDTIQDGQACDSTVTLQLSYYDPPALQLSSSGSLCAGGTATLEATGQGTFEWDDGSTGNTLSVSAPGTYRVTLTGANGCPATDSLTLTEDTPDFTGSTGFEGCPAEAGGYVQADSVWGGTPPYLFALEGARIAGREPLFGTGRRHLPAFRRGCGGLPRQPQLHLGYTAAFGRLPARRYQHPPWAAGAAAPAIECRRGCGQLAAAAGLVLRGLPLAHRQPGNDHGLRGHPHRQPRLHGYRFRHRGGGSDNGLVRPHRFLPQRRWPQRPLPALHGCLGTGSAAIGGLRPLGRAGLHLGQ